MNALDNNPGMDDRNRTNVLDRLDDFSELEDGNVTTVYSECIKASWLSYRDKDVLANYSEIPSYFMITQCFGNNASYVDLTKCQNPSEFDNGIMLPVTSSDTGRIYSNSYCARCNNDERDMLPWTASVQFYINIAYFTNNSLQDRSHYPDTYNCIPIFISQTGKIVYTPPFPQDDKLCLRKNTLMTCEDLRLNRPTTVSLLEKACKCIYSPLGIYSVFGVRFPFQNIFCYLCQQQHEQYIQPSTSRQCDNDNSHDKDIFEGMSALLDYTTSESSYNAVTIAPRQGNGHCDEIYDHHLVSKIIMAIMMLFRLSIRNVSVPITYLA